MEMADYTPIVLNVTSEEHERGYDDPSEYLRALIEADAEDDEEDLDDIRKDIKQGLREAFRGEGIPLEDF
jgi:hypothetical protein